MNAKSNKSTISATPSAYLCLEPPVNLNKKGVG